MQQPGRSQRRPLTAVQLITERSSVRIIIIITRIFGKTRHYVLSTGRGLQWPVAVTVEQGVATKFDDMKVIFLVDRGFRAHRQL